MRTRCAELFGLLPVEGLGERSELLEPLGLPVHGEAESAPLSGKLDFALRAAFCGRAVVDSGGGSALCGPPED